MKYLINCTVLVYLSQIRADWFERIAVTTTVRVADEAKYLLSETQKEHVMKNIEVIRSSHTNEEDRYLSITDLELAKLAEKQNYLLVTDDKKLKNRANARGAKAFDLPHWVEYLTKRGTISREEALVSLAQLEKKYNRERIVQTVIKRIKEGN